MRHTTRLLLAIGKIKGVGVKTLAQISESDISHITDAGDLLSYVHSERFPLKRKASLTGIFILSALEDLKTIRLIFLPKAT